MKRVVLGFERVNKGRVPRGVDAKFPDHEMAADRTKTEVAGVEWLGITVRKYFFTIAPKFHQTVLRDQFDVIYVVGGKQKRSGPKIMGGEQRALAGSIVAPKASG